MRAPAICLLSMLAVHCFSAEAPKCPPPPGHIDIESGSFSSQAGVTFKLTGFAAKVVARSNRAPLCYLRTTDVERGQVFVSATSLSNVFKQKLKQSKSKLEDVKIETADGIVRVAGKVKKLIPVDFTIEGPLTTDGKTLTLEGKKIKADGIPVKGLLDMVGAHINALMGAKKVTGVAVNGNNLSFDPEQLGHIRGYIEAATASPQGLTLKYRNTTPQVAANGRH